MNNTIHWGFANTPATFTTDKEKFEVTVSKLRTSLNIHPDHEITIYNHAANQPVNNDAISSDSISNTPSTPTISVRAKKSKPVEETTELFDVPTILDNVDPESDVL
jgi:hypothetical protein